jgi:ABC-type sugar transport system substrate-binding protein
MVRREQEEEDMKLQKGLAVLFALTMAVGARAAEAGGAAANNAFLSDAMGLSDGSFLPNVPKPAKKYKIANITRTLMNAHWVKNKEGFLAAAAHYGVTGDVFAVQTEQEVMEQANLLDSVVTKGYDAVIVSPISEKNLLPGLAKAARKGIKIINVDTAKIQEADAKTNGIPIVTFIGSDNFQAGVMALDYVKSKLGDKPGPAWRAGRVTRWPWTAPAASSIRPRSTPTSPWRRLRAGSGTASWRWT